MTPLHPPSNRVRALVSMVIVTVLSMLVVSVDALVHPQPRPHSLFCRRMTSPDERTRVRLRNNHPERVNENDEDDELYTVTRPLEGVHTATAPSSSSSSPTTTTNYMDDLTPPPINLKRDSILFSDNPSTIRNNEALDVWRFCKDHLPPVLTGNWPWRDMDHVADKNPLGGLYNMFFVRVPVVVLGLVYLRNYLVEGHALIVDFGHGPFEMSPLVVVAVLALILA